MAGASLPPVRIGDGSAERMPTRIEVAFVRELAPAAPPAAPGGDQRRAGRNGAPRPRQPAPSGLGRAATRRAVAEPPSRCRAGAAAPAAAAARCAASEPLPDAVASAASRRVGAAGLRVAAVDPAELHAHGNYRGEVQGGAQVEWVRRARATRCTWTSCVGLPASRRWWRGA